MLDEFTKRQVEQNPIEAKILRKIVKATKAAHDPIVCVNNGEDTIAVETRDEILTAVFAVDDVFLELASGRWILFIPGNEWDCISDYIVSLEDTLSEVNAYVEKFSD